MAQTKATKKFEKRHLKDTLDRRNSLKKVKQKQQLKAKKKARRAEENGGPTAMADKEVNVAKKSVKDAFQDMSVDDFFQGGFDVPDLPKQSSKRKRVEDVEEDDDSDDSILEQPVEGLSDSEQDSDDDSVDHKQQLDALAETDPEFHKYLQENEPELLEGNLEEIGELSDDEEPTRKKQKKSQRDEEDEMEEEGTSNELTKTTINKWEAALTTQHSLRTAREVVMAFRSAVHVSDDEDQEFKYSVSNPEVYHALLTLALKHIPSVFEHHLPTQIGKNGKVHVPTESKKFKTITPMLRSQLGSILHLLDHLSDAATLRLTLTSTMPLLPYLLSFKKLLRDLIKAVTNVWSTSSNTEATRISAFLILRRVMSIADAGIRENVLKATYQAFIKGARNTTTHTIAGVNLMKNSAAGLWRMDTSVGYTTAFTFIRQLGIHLRGSIQNNAKESYKNVYNWQYVHSLDFWSRVLSTHATTASSPLHLLIYPLVQVTLGAVRLIPTATYFPLRFQLVRSLLRISRTTNTYIPLASALYEVLSSAEMRKAPKPSTLKPLDFSTSIRVSKAYLRTRTYQDGLGEEIQFLLAEFLGLWAKHVAFPELALAVTVMLKRWLKDVNSRVPGKGNKNQKVNGMVSLLVQKVEANARWIEERRSKVEFAPDMRKEVESFLEGVEWERSPLGAFVAGLRRVREEKARVLESSRRNEERKIVVEQNGRKRREEDAEEMDVDGDSEEEKDFEVSDEEEEGEDIVVDGDDESE